MQMYLPQTVVSMVESALSKREMLQRAAIPVVRHPSTAAAPVADAALDDCGGLVFSFGSGEEGAQALRGWLEWVYHDGDGRSPSGTLPPVPDALSEEWSGANQRLAYHKSNYDRVHRALQMPLQRHPPLLAGENDERLEVIQALRRVAEGARDMMRKQITTINEELTKFVDKSAEFWRSMGILQKQIDQAVDYEHRAELQPPTARARGQHNAQRHRSEIEKARSVRKRYSADRTEKVKQFMGTMSNTVAKEPTKTRVKQILDQVDALLLLLNFMIETRVRSSIPRLPHPCARPHASAEDQARRFDRGAAAPGAPVLLRVLQ